MKTYFLNKDRLAGLLLVAGSFIIYSAYFHHIFLNINSLLSSNTLDTLKNYYTFIYHTVNDNDLLEFGGMNYPYGEHVVYTDCQPLLTFLLKMLPFTHNYLIGVLHALIFGSFIITPFIIYRIFLHLEINRLVAAFCALAITLLSPQFLKINAGHHGLTYAFMIPFAILLCLRYTAHPSFQRALAIMMYSSALFLIHPYMGFSVSAFCLVTLLPSTLKSNTVSLAGKSANLFLIGIAPALLFRLFMAFTDHHKGRTPEPFGLNEMVENLNSLLAPVFGPFRGLMEEFFLPRPQHFEGHSYLGFFTILVSVLFLLFLPFSFKKLTLKKELSAMLIAALCLLLVSFGWHRKLMETFHISSVSLNQFRAVSRFAWFFYYALPIFLIPVIYHSCKNRSGTKNFAITAISASVLFLLFNLLEADALFKMDREVFWKSRNIFNPQLLTGEEIRNINRINAAAPQAIIPLPLYHGGSEMYERPALNSPMQSSMLYSFHCKLPILSAMMSRTSIDETEATIGLLNSYKKNRPAIEKLTEKPFVVIKTKETLLPDEMRLWRKVKNPYKSDGLEFATVQKADFLKRIWPKNASDSEIIYVHKAAKRPYLTANMADYETMYVLDSNLANGGKYVVSFHFHYTEKDHRSVACDLIVTKKKDGSYAWVYDIPVRIMSGFYDGFGICEYFIDLEADATYEFVLKGNIQRQYHVSDFMLRDENVNVVQILGQDTIINNFPPR
jgi:hypothetical protein